MSRRGQDKLKIGDKEDEAGDMLDEKLRQLGDEFLEEEVPEALLDVLRRGMEKRSDRTGNRREDGTAKAPDHEEQSRDD